MRDSGRQNSIFVSRERKGKTNTSVVLLKCVFQVPALFPKRRLLNLTRFNLCWNARTRGEVVQVLHMPHAPAPLITNPHHTRGAAAGNSSWWRWPWAAAPHHSTAQDFGCLSYQPTLSPEGGWLAAQGKVAPSLGAALLGGVRKPATATKDKEPSRGSHHEPHHPVT